MLDSFFPERFLLRSQKNELYDLVRGAGLSPADFRMVEPDGTMMTPTGPPPPTLRHEPGGRSSGYYFQVDPEGPERFVIEMSPANDLMKASYVAPSWVSVVGIFKVWLEILMLETSQPDLWGGILASATSVPASAPNDSFTDDEVAGVRHQLEAARRYLEAQPLPTDRLAEANAKLDLLVEATERLGKRDWSLFALGVVVDIAINAAFSGAQAHGLFQLVTGVVRGLSWWRLAVGRARTRRVRRVLCPRASVPVGGLLLGMQARSPPRPITHGPWGLWTV